MLHGKVSQDFDIWYLMKIVLQKERSKEYYLNYKNNSYSHFSLIMFYIHKRIHLSLYDCCYSISRYVSSSSNSIQSNSRAKLKMVSQFFYSFVVDDVYFKWWWKRVQLFRCMMDDLEIGKGVVGGGGLGRRWFYPEIQFWWCSHSLLMGAVISGKGNQTMNCNIGQSQTGLSDHNDDADDGEG